MRLRTPLLSVLAASTLALSLASCGDDDGDDGTAGDSPETTASSDSGDDTAAADDAQAVLDQRIADYQTYVVDEANSMLAETKAFTDAVRAGDIDEAKSLFAKSRYHWETIEPLAGLVATVDGAVDSRVDDFASVTDPTFTGWHRLEYMLWVDGKLTKLSSKYATQLDKDLAPLPDLLADLDMTIDDVTTGAAGLIEEVSEGKITGEEDRYSHTDLYDLAANVNGSLRAFQVYEPVLADLDKDLETKIEANFTAAKSLLASYQETDGSYVSFLELKKSEDKDKLQAMLATLSEDLSNVSGVLAQ